MREARPVNASRDKVADLRSEIVALIPRLRRFALGLTRNRDEADDMVQLALERGLARLSHFTIGTRLDSWMFRILQNAWIDQARRRQRDGAPVDLDAIAELTPDALEDAARLSVQREVQQAMTALSADQRALVMLVLVEGYSYQEAADIVEIPVGTVMSRLSRARQILMDRLSVDGERP
jgi:RNA polymerase sigma factor, sigma-70 family